MKDVAKMSGHRIYDRHFKILKKFAKRMKIDEAEVLRSAIEYFNAYGALCKHCYGKGYSTRGESGKKIAFCVCERGKQLQDLIEAESYGKSR